jgi:predicted secreted protein
MKTSSILAVAICLGLYFACGQTLPETAGHPADTAEAAPPSSIFLRCGDETTIELAASPRTGCTWYYETSNNWIVGIGRQYAPPEKRLAATSRSAGRAPVYFKIKALKEGRVRLRFLLRSADGRCQDEQVRWVDVGSTKL